MNNLYISNNRIISSFYLGYQPFPRSWEINKEDARATLIFGSNRIEMINEIWHKIFKDIMILEGICSPSRSIELDVREFEIDFDKEGVIVRYLYSPKEIV